MDSKLRKQALEDYAKNVADGLTDSDYAIPRSSDYLDNALQARNLAEDSLANEVLKKTGVPIPGKGAKKSQIEHFFGDLLKERYPELENKGIEIRNLPDSYGTYNPKSGIIQLNEDIVRHSPIKSTSTLLHEAGHKYDKEILNNPGTNNIENKELRKIKKQELLNAAIDPTELYERVAEGHHASIPKLREGSFGLGALKSLLKSGTFKGLAPVGVGSALALSSDDASASDFIPGLDQASPVGESSDEEAQLLGEIKGHKDYKNSQAAKARKMALEKLGNK